MRSGELARAMGVSTDTLRHYERLGLLRRPARTPGNYRAYPPSSKQRVELIRRALKIGFSLAELKTILTVRDSGGAPCHHVRKLLGTKIRHLADQIENLTLLHSELNQLARDWDKRLRRTRAGQPARLLEAVPQGLDTFGAPRPPSIKSKKGR